MKSKMYFLPLDVTLSPKYCKSRTMLTVPSKITRRNILKIARNGKSEDMLN